MPGGQNLGRWQAAELWPGGGLWEVGLSVFAFSSKQQELHELPCWQRHQYDSRCVLLSDWQVCLQHALFERSSARWQISCRPFCLAKFSMRRLR